MDQILTDEFGYSCMSYRRQTRGHGIWRHVHVRAGDSVVFKNQLPRPRKKGLRHKIGMLINRIDVRACACTINFPPDSMLHIAIARKLIADSNFAIMIS
ncbi:hypothetical protein EYR41_005293 [Orbilia oligospora]|uniref:Uncharacterized protein n=1 Tax=Orbilia oligospora TaxID=2813651 RepID=A0A8H2E244_ORBOL|nr:hypothetical protein EYR41_005293 [Orbilia oligospora]